MQRILTAAILFVAVTATAIPAMAHFQMLYTPETALEKAKTIDMELVFTHPFEAGHTMDMGEPEEFFVVRKGRKTDLMDSLQPIQWTSLSNSGQGYEASYRLRGMGDNVFCLVPEPYFESNEDVYIQQITKTIVNTGGFPTDWDSEIGLPTEIVPLAKPYALWTGNVFRGIVKSQGKPVPFAEIEVEYLNHEPRMQDNSFAKNPKAKAPQSSFVTQTIKANVNGEFSYALPKSGWWGFCALGSGPDTTYKGKELSQDAVLWVQAKDMD